MITNYELKKTTTFVPTGSSISGKIMKDNKNDSDNKQTETIESDI